jgi:hypothetical protein
LNSPTNHRLSFQSGQAEGQVIRRKLNPVTGVKDPGYTAVTIGLCLLPEDDVLETGVSLWIKASAK